MIIDFGHHVIKSEICKNSDLPEGSTQMEIEEQMYSRIYADSKDAQILFCDNSENWRDSKKEKDTELHLLPKFGFTAVYAYFVRVMKTVPK